MLQLTRRTRRVKKRIFNYIIFMGIFSYITYNLVISIMNTGIHTYTAKKGQLVETISEKGVIVRDEQVFYSNGQGVPKYLFKEGERISSNSNVCEIQTGSSDHNLKEESETMQRRISIIETGTVYSAQMATQEKMDRLISVKKHEIKNSFMSDSTIAIQRLKTEILYALDQKSILYGSLSGSSGKEDVSAKISNIESKMNTGTKFIKNTFPGVLSLYADGYEEKLKPDQIGKMDSQTLSEIQNKNLITKGSSINEGAPAFNIVNNHYWYVLFVLEPSQAKLFEKGKWMSIKKDNETISGMIKDIYKDSHGKYIMSFKTNSNTPMSYEKRVYNMDLVLKNLSGIKIPKEAVISKNGKKGAYVISETGVAVFKELKCVLGENSEYVILDDKSIMMDKVDTVTLYDEVILNPQKVKEGKKIK